MKAYVALSAEHHEFWSRLFQSSEKKRAGLADALVSLLFLPTQKDEEQLFEGANSWSYCSRQDLSFVVGEIPPLCCCQALLFGLYRTLSLSCSLPLYCWGYRSL